MAEMLEGASTTVVLNEVILLAKRAYRCRGDCTNLVATLEFVVPLLASIEQSCGSENVTCHAWLKDLRSLLEKAEGIVQNCGKSASFMKKSNFMRKSALSMKIHNIDRHIQEILSEGYLVIRNNVRGIDQSPSFEMQHVPPCIVAFENNEFRKLKELILSEPSSGTKTIGIKGKGGAGKTLLAKMVNNDVDVQRKYGDHSILWLTIGQDESVTSIYRRMGKFLNDGAEFERVVRGRDLEAQRIYLMEAFKQMRTLVILDDIWGNCVKSHPMTYWLDIFKGEGSTTLITTRDKKVLDRVKATERIEVELLSKEDSWKLFSFHAFQPSIPLSYEVKDIAMEICDECKGLPLALEVIGGALWDTKDKRKWIHALSSLKRFESWLPSMEDDLFHRLKFSYDVLSDDEKMCFLYFAAFPEDYRIPTKQLLSIWEAEKLFGSCDVEDTLNMGRMNLITLADRSLIDLDENGEYAKVHDVMRDLAMRIIRAAKIGEWAYECQYVPMDEHEEYLKLTESCMEQVLSITLSLTHSLVSFNDQQCKYLAEKLKLVVKDANSFVKLIKKKCLQFPCEEESLRAYCLKIFKLLHASAKEVENFIQRHCCKDVWLQAAISLSNVSEYVSAIGFDLELWRLVFSQNEKLGVGLNYTLTDVDTIFKSEVGNIKKKALDDKKMLLRKMNAVQKKESKTSAESQLATLLLQRLEGGKSDILHSRMAQLEEAMLPNLIVKKQLGKGSVAVVYEATLFGGEVALKTFEGLHNIDFNKEVSILRGLSHPNIISLLCSGTYCHGKCSIVIELINGDLAWLINERLREMTIQNFRST